MAACGLSLMSRVSFNRERASIPGRQAAFYGTGSWPPLQKGWHRARRHTVYKKPHRAPCFPIASMAYWEQVGRKRQ